MKKISAQDKIQLHPRNKHRERYDFEILVGKSPELAPFIFENSYGDSTIDFFNPSAVKALNKALLLTHYGISFWDIPEKYLCPPIPGRADYIHCIADLIGQKKINKTIRCLDIGTGANCIYPLIGNREYGWSFIGVDIDPVAITSAQRILDHNKGLKKQIQLRKQPNPKDILKGSILKKERFDVSLCNPPFHSSFIEAQKGTSRKLKNLTKNKAVKIKRNFGGQSNELWCDGGEKKFVGKMILQSKEFAEQCYWFTSLVSKEAHLKSFKQTLKKLKAEEIKIISMGQGNKKSRIIAWTFLTIKEQNAWRDQKNDNLQF